MKIYRVLENNKETFFKNYDKAFEYAKKVINDNFSDKPNLKKTYLEALALYDHCGCVTIDDFSINYVGDNLDTVYVLSDLAWDFNFTSVHANKESALEVAEQFLEDHYLWGLNPEDEERAYRYDMWLLSNYGYTMSGTFELNRIKLTD